MSCPHCSGDHDLPLSDHPDQWDEMLARADCIGEAVRRGERPVPKPELPKTREEFVDRVHDILRGI